MTQLVTRALATGMVLALLLGGCGGQEEDADVSVFRIRPGDCFDDPPADRALDEVDVVPCTEPHDNEVFATVDHPAGEGAAFPGRDAVVGHAREACPGPFADYVGVAYEQSRFSLFPIVPSEATWGQGDRQIICALYDHEAGKITGSVRGSGR